MPQRITVSRYFDVRNSVGAIVVGTCVLASPGSTTIAQAQPNAQMGREAWCVDMGNLGGYLECYYHTYAQCAAAARGVTNVCQANSFYVPRPPQRQRRDPRR
jgi:hypothetical protein